MYKRQALEHYFQAHAEKIPLVDLVVPNNLNGGMGVSMADIKETRRIIDKYNKRGTLLCLDIARISENAWIIKNHEEGYQDKSCLDIRCV